MADKKKKPNMIAEMGMRMGLRPDTRKKLPKAPPMSPVRSLAKLNDAEFNKLQKAVENYTKEKGPTAVAALFKSFNQGRDKNQYYKNVDTAEQLVPMVKAEAKKRKSKSTVKKSAGMSVGRANYPGKKKPQEGPMYDPRKTTVKPKKKTVKKKGGGSIGCSHNRLY
jgi:hypothetical protein